MLVSLSLTETPVTLPSTKEGPSGDAGHAGKAEVGWEGGVTEHHSALGL